MADSQRAQLKKTAKHSAIYAVGTMLRRLTGLVMLPIYTRYLTPADYGAVELLSIAIEVMGILVGLRISQALFRFYILEDDVSERQRIVSTVMLTIIASTTVGALILSYFASTFTQLIFGSQDYVFEFQLFAVTLMTNAITAVGLSYLRARQMPVFFVAVGIISLLTQVAMNIYFVVHLEMHVTGVVYSAVISGVLISAALIVYVFSSVGIHFSITIARCLINYISPLILASLGGFYVAYADKYFLRVFGSLTDVGIYALAARLSSVLFTVFEAFNLSWGADRFEVVKKDDAQKIFEQVFRFLSAGLLLAATSLALFASDFFRIMTTPDFYAASYLVPLFMLSIIAKVFTIYCNFGALYRDRTSVIATASWIKAVIATVGYLTLIPLYGVYGAVFALAGSAVMEFLWVYRQSVRLYDMGLRWSKISMLFGICVIAVASGLLLPEGDLAAFGIRLVIFMLLIVSMYHAPVWSSDERAMIKAGISKLISLPLNRLRS